MCLGIAGDFGIACGIANMYVSIGILLPTWEIRISLLTQGIVTVWLRTQGHGPYPLPLPLLCPQGHCCRIIPGGEHLPPALTALRYSFMEHERLTPYLVGVLVFNSVCCV